MAKPKVVVARMTPGLESTEIWDAFDIWAWKEDRVMPEAMFREKAAGADGLLVTTFEPIDAALLDAAPSLKVVSVYAVGVDAVDLPACTARGVPVGNTPGVVTQATADMALALMLSFSRRVLEGDAFVRAGKWESWSPYLMISNDVHGKTLGMVGMGRIGQAIAKRAAGFDMKILYHSRTPKPEAERELGVVRASLDDLLARSDIVVIILPLTDQTRHMIDAAALAKMKKNALLINVARGGVVDHKALYQALSSGAIRGAAADVTEPEPLPRDDPLLTLDNFLVAPHVATGTWECRGLMTDLAVKNLMAGMRGESLAAYANPDVVQKA